MSRRIPNQARSHDVSAPLRGPAVAPARAADLTADQLTFLWELWLRGRRAGRDEPVTCRVYSLWGFHPDAADEAVLEREFARRGKR